MAIVNPPYALEAEMQAVLPVLHALLAEDLRAAWSIEWLAGEI